MPSFSLLKRASRGFGRPPGEGQQQQQQQQQQAQTQARELAPQTSSTAPKSPPTTPRRRHHNAKPSPDVSANEDTTSSGGPGSGGGGRVSDRERRFSKRDLLQGLLGRARGGRASHPGATEGAASPPPDPSKTPSPPLTSPRSPILVDPNKPLPSPPPPGIDDDPNRSNSFNKANGPGATAVQPKPSPVLKLDRIMATLSEDDIEKLFSGAPQYFARSEGHYTGAPHPSVAFPWDEALEIRDLTDHAQIEDQAWSCVTAWPHITRDVNRNHAARAKAPAVPADDGDMDGATKARPHFYPRCRERPSMLSAQGLEKGSLGYQAALELAVADILLEEQYGFDSLGSKGKLIVEQRQKLLTSKDGLRHMDEEAILARMIEAGRHYRTNHLKRGTTSSAELYNELFLHVLHPPTKVLDHNDPYSLAVQIYALLRVLAAPNVWVDFSHVEWRIRLGQILWGGGDQGDELDDSSSIHDAETLSERNEERYWVLLQILLACELLIRLDAITEGEELGVESIRPHEVLRFERDATPSVKWSLHLARAWLENIEVSKVDVVGGDAAGCGAVDHSQHTSTGWLASLTGKMSLHHHHQKPHEGGAPIQHGHEHEEQHPHHISPNYTMRGRYGQRQVNGLTHFARKLRWPDIDAYEASISESCRTVTQPTPLRSPVASPMTGTSATSRSSYFGSAAIEPGEGHPSRRRKLQAALHPSGWLSKSYVSGLVLPGEGLSHFLMATLLENDKEAMRRLGPMANLCGGFVYCGKSFWSTACVVGRVLAAGTGTSECMGWISTDVVPQNLGDGWVNIEVDDVPEDVKRTGKKARLWGKTYVEKESDVLGGADPSSILPADFIIPYENQYPREPPRITVQLTSLNLFAPVSSLHTTPTEEKAETPFSDATRPPEILTYPASIAFSVHTEGEEEGNEVTDYNIALSSDIHFVTAHPCVPSSKVKFIKSPSSPTIQQIDVSDAGVGGKAFSPASVTGHPLHKFFTYTVIHLSELLARKDSSLEDLLLHTTSTRRPSLTPAQDTKPRVLVIDCITGFNTPPTPDATPTSPILDRKSDGASPAAAQMHLESRRRQFGSDMEVLVRALCAEKGWNALVSRRRRGCLACAIREAGALAWKVVVRVD